MFAKESRGELKEILAVHQVRYFGHNLTYTVGKQETALRDLD